MARASGHTAGRAESLLSTVWRSKLYVLLLACFLFSLGLSIILPALPQLATNYFASRHAGYPVDCDAYSMSEQPKACQTAHSDVVRWASLNSLVANTFLGFFFAPLIGDLSDRLGRKPFMLVGITLGLMPVGAIWSHVTHGTSFMWYYPLNALTAVVAPIILFLSYTADVLRPELRTSGFGLVTASFSVSFFIGPTIGSILGAVNGAAAAMVSMVVSLLLIAVALPETCRPKPEALQGPPGLRSAPSGTAAAAAGLSASPAAVATAAARRRRPLDMFRSMGRSWALINSSSMFRRLALCMAVIGVVSEGIQDMLLQYLQLVMGFNTADQAVLITVLGAGNVVVQALLLPSLSKFLGERRLLVFGLMFSITEQALLSLSSAKWQAISAVSLSALAGVSFPAISSLKSTHASPEQQGLVQGALAGIRAVAAGVGPLGLAQLFAMSTTADGALGYKPSIVFWTTCALTVVAAAVAASIPADAAKIHREDSSHHHHHAPAGSEDSDADSNRAWLLGAEDEEEDAVCRVCKGRYHGRKQQGDASQQGDDQHTEVPDTGVYKECSCQDRCVLVVVDSPASDTESVMSDQMQVRDQQQQYGQGAPQSPGRDQQRTAQQQQQQPSRAAWYATPGHAAATDNGSSSSSSMLQQSLLPDRDV